jgi:hypothetical protein
MHPSVIALHRSVRRWRSARILRTRAAMWAAAARDLRRHGIKAAGL